MTFDFVLAIVGGIVLIVFAGGVLWLLTVGITEVVDRVAGAIEWALRKAANRW